MKKVLAILILVSAAGCKKNEPVKKEGVIHSDSAAKRQSTPDLPIATENLKQINGRLLQSLKDKDYKTFAAYIHPEKGVRFSIYAFVNPDADKKFSRQDFEKYIGTNVKFTWGEKDGTGDLLVTSLKDYLSGWVFKKDFTRAEYTEDGEMRYGNSLSNMKKIYPDARYAVNFLEGTEEYSGMDWCALGFVFEKFNGKYYLVAVVNDEWTI